MCRIGVLRCLLFLTIFTIRRNLGFFGHGERVTCIRPTNFPNSILLTQQTFQNWADEIIVPNLWTAIPKTPDDVVKIANWAVENDYQVRASGFMHNWSPLTVTPAQTCANRVLLVKTTEYLTQMRISSRLPKAAVTVQAGATIEAFLTFLEANGLGILASPAVGQVSLGGLLVLGGHGTGVPAVGESIKFGYTFGTLSNLILSFTAVVWDSSANGFTLQTFDRSHPEASAFLVNLGRTILTEVTLRVGPNYNLRCQSKTNVPASELFAGPNSGASTRTFARYLDSSGRVETIWYPFTSYPWLKVWSLSPKQPLTSRKVNSPYNYIFSDNLPYQVAAIAASIVSGQWQLAPTLGQTEYAVTFTGLELSHASDLWGPSKNLLLYVKPTTLRYTEFGCVIITSRSNVQNVISRTASFYSNLIRAYAKESKFPINGPLEVRASGLDIPEDSGIVDAKAPSISPIRPIDGHPELNTAVWFNILTFPHTPLQAEFMGELESFLIDSVHDGISAIVRPEWSKGWAYTSRGAWTNETILSKTIPSSFTSSANSRLDEWSWVTSIFDKYDPNRVFSNTFLDKLFRK